MSYPLLQTKFYLPAARPALVRRSHLIERLGSGSNRPITLVSAPAGFGKTTLVSEWVSNFGFPIFDFRLASTAEETSQNPKSKIQNRVAWLSLDEDDNEPVRFLTYLIAALQTCLPTIGESALALLDAPQAPPAKLILTQLINDLGTHTGSLSTGPLCLVLDDYHLITSPAIHEALSFFIDHLPATLHLVISSRVDPPLPLARWRVRNQLREIRAADLRFLPEEADAFLNQAMGLALSNREIAQLTARTEGWIAGLQLAALSLQGRRDAGNFIQQFTGSNTYIIDYLIEEVLQRQPEAVQRFLQQTSILQRLCGSLCNALTGRSNGQALLEQLQRANLFIIALDDERRWYRYHHLFAEVLYSRLLHTQPEQVATLHRCACDWYEAADLLDEAMRHALAANDLERAATLIEQHSITLLLRSQVTVVNGWLQSLPVPLIESRPLLALAAAWVYMTARQLDRLAHMLYAVPILQSPNLEPLVQSQLLILQACLALFQGDSERAASNARRGLQLVPAGLDSLRATALLILGSALAQTNDWQAATPVLRETIQVGIAGGNLFNVMLAYHILSRFQSGRGDVTAAIATLNEALQVVAQQEQALIPAVGVIDIGLGALWLEQGKLAQAEAALLRGEERVKACFQLDILLYGWQAQVKLFQTRGDSAQALTVVEGAVAWLQAVVVAESMRQPLLQELRHLRQMLEKDAESMPDHTTPLSQPLIEPLSERELEILRLVNDGLSNSEIAGKIIVTVGTVKKHLNNIFGKLGVGSRTQAIVRARTLELL
jgi:LuxR family transcriptional regulator, maltose regulon positive regulatory protein